MHVLFGCEFFVKVESTRHLEDVLPVVVLHFSGFVEGHKGAVGAQYRSGAKGWTVGERMVWDGPPVSSLIPYEHQCFIVCICLCPFWDRMMVLCLLRPMLGRQEAHLQIRYVFAVWDFD